MMEMTTSTEPGDHPGATVVRSRAELAHARAQKQLRVLLIVAGTMLFIGFVGLGNWLAWWSIGGTGQRIVAAVPCPVQVVTSADSSKVNVLNGTGRSGLAAAVAKELQKRKFPVLSIATEEQEKPIKAVALIRFGPEGRLAATTVARQFPSPVKMAQSASHEGETVDLVIGERYKNMVSAKKGAAAIKPKKMPENCTTATPTPATEDVSGA